MTGDLQNLPHEVLGAHLLWGFFFFEAHLLGEEKKEFTVRCYPGPSKKSAPAKRTGLKKGRILFKLED
jgi:hypothetical protein